MQRYNLEQDNGIADHLEIIRRSAFHEAGHAAAIYFENKRKKLPSIYFHIQLHKHNGMASPFFTKICGGRQIGDPLMIAREKSVDTNSYQLAYEADIINYLAGPLAEAKYVAIRDNESFNVNLLSPKSLKNYGGHADLIEVSFYLESFLSSKNEREAKLNELFAEAFRFIQVVENWELITALANYILNCTEEYISFDQVSWVLQPMPLIES